MTWWRDGAIYQVYPRSFQDSDGDGTGDLEGVRRRLPYLKWLGVDGVWLSPFYRSPMADFGYDVSDHCDVDPVFGTLEDFDALAADAHRLGLKLILDYVPNHTSIEHPWFRERPEYYLWADAVPNNWVSDFGGPAWTRRRRPLLLPRLSARAARPELAPRRRPRGDARRPALLVRARRRRLPDRRAAPADQGRPAARQPGRTRTGARATTRTRALIPEFTTDRPEVQDAIRAFRDAVGDERLLLGELYLPIERLVAYYASGLDMPANFHLLTTPWTPRDVADAGRALRGRAARRRVAELGARQPRPPAAGVAPAAGPRARRRVPAADPARHADALLRRRDRDARRRDRARAARRPVGVRQPRPACARRCSGTRAGSFTDRRAVAAVRGRPRARQRRRPARRPRLAALALPPPARAAPQPSPTCAPAPTARSPPTTASCASRAATRSRSRSTSRPATDRSTGPGSPHARPWSTICASWRRESHEYRGAAEPVFQSAAPRG